MPGRGANGEELPYSLLSVLHLHQQRANRLTTMPKPPGIDPHEILKEREYRFVPCLALVAHRLAHYLIIWDHFVITI